MINTALSNTLCASPGVEDTRLNAAKDTLSCALKALIVRDYALADLLAKQARWEAEMAEQHAQSAGTRQAAHDAQAAAQALHLQIDRIDVLLFDHKPAH